MIQFIVVSSFFLQDYISFIFSLVFSFVVFSFGVVVFLSSLKQALISDMLMVFLGNVPGSVRNSIVFQLLLAVSVNPVLGIITSRKDC